MNIQQIKQLIDEHVEKIAVNSKSLANARQLAGEFLIAQSVLATFLKDFDDDKSKLMTMEKATYAQTVKSVEGKNVTEKKINVEADPTYANSREAVEKLDHLRDYIRTHMKIFENAHLLFRQFSKE